MKYGFVLYASPSLTSLRRPSEDWGSDLNPGSETIFDKVSETLMCEKTNSSSEADDGILNSVGSVNLKAGSFLTN